MSIPAWGLYLTKGGLRRSSEEGVIPLVESRGPSPHRGTGGRSIGGGGGMDVGRATRGDAPSRPPCPTALSPFLCRLQVQLLSLGSLPTLRALLTCISLQSVTTRLLAPDHLGLKQLTLLGGVSPRLWSHRGPMPTVSAGTKPIITFPGSSPSIKLKKYSRGLSELGFFLRSLFDRHTRVCIHIHARAHIPRCAN